MTKIVTNEHYKSGYNRIHNWLKFKHPEIYEEYINDCIKREKRTKEILELAMK